MKIFFFPNGEPWGALFDNEIQRTLIEPSASTIFEVDEIDENKELCIELRRDIHKRNSLNQARWYLQDNQLYERDNWTSEVVIP